MSNGLILVKYNISTNHYLLLYCDTLLQHLSYIHYLHSAVRKTKKITLRIRNICFLISQLDKINLKKTSDNPSSLLH